MSTTQSQQRFINDLDGIDAAVFSGDVLYDSDTREPLKESCERWLRAIAEHEKTNGPSASPTVPTQPV